MHTPGDAQVGDGGRVLAGRYRVRCQLGRGGMGVVCRAHDEVLGRDVAVKELRTFSDAAASELAAFRLRMQREARAAARVRHPGVIAVHDITEHEGRPVIVMELVDGPSLDDVLRDRGTLDPAEVADIGAKVLDALAAAHRSGVLHRDVKPGNVLLENGGRVVLTDFGIAAVEEPGDGAATQLTRSGELVGSLDYLAPERARGEDPGRASDVWSLGATLYAAVEGCSPFRRTSTWSTLTAIVAEPLPEARNAGPLGSALRALMEKDPTRRPDAASAAALLREVTNGAPGPVGRATGTMRLGAVSGPGRPAAANPPAGSVPVSGGPHAPAHSADVAGGSPDPADRDTDRSTLNTHQTDERRRRTLVAVSVAAVMLVAAGVAWGVTAYGPHAAKEPAAASQAPSAGEHSGTESPGKEAKEAGEKAGKENPSPDASEPPSASPAQSAAPAASGPDDGTGDGGGSGGGDAGGTGTAGGADGGGGGADGGGADGGSTGGDDSTGGTSGGGSEPEPACHAIGEGKYHCQVWKTADSYNTQHQKVGTLYSGTNYFYCQQNIGYRETYGQWTNTWWAKTDDDSGNTGVWVSLVYIQGGDNDEPVPGLPTC